MSQPNSDLRVIDYYEASSRDFTPEQYSPMDSSTWGCFKMMVVVETDTPRYFVSQLTANLHEAGICTLYGLYDPVRYPRGNEQKKAYKYIVSGVRPHRFNIVRVLEKPDGKPSTFHPEVKRKWFFFKEHYKVERRSQPDCCNTTVVVENSEDNTFPAYIDMLIKDNIAYLGLNLLSVSKSLSGSAEYSVVRRQDLLLTGNEVYGIPATVEYEKAIPFEAAANILSKGT